MLFAINSGFYSKLNTEPTQSPGSLFGCGQKMQICREWCWPKNLENSGGEASCGAGEEGREWIRGWEPVRASTSSGFRQQSQPSLNPPNPHTLGIFIAPTQTFFDYLRTSSPSSIPYCQPLRQSSTNADPFQLRDCWRSWRIRGLMWFNGI